MTLPRECLEDSRLNQVLLEQGLGRPVEEWIRRWDRFVESVERGYQMTAYDYLNDIDTRRILDEAMEATSSFCRDLLSAMFKPLDERYQDATVPAPTNERWQRPGDSWYRRPVRLRGELAKDMGE